MQYISHYQSPLGDILLAADEIGLTGLWFEGQNTRKKSFPYLNRQKNGLIPIFPVKIQNFKFPFTLQAQIFKMKCGKSSTPFHTDRR